VRRKAVYVPIQSNPNTGNEIAGSKTAARFVAGNSLVLRLIRAKFPIINNKLSDCRLEASAKWIQFWFKTWRLLIWTCISNGKEIWKSFVSNIEKSANGVHGNCKDSKLKVSQLPLPQLSSLGHIISIGYSQYFINFFTKRVALRKTLWLLLDSKSMKEDSFEFFLKTFRTGCYP